VAAEFAPEGPFVNTETVCPANGSLPPAVDVDVDVVVPHAATLAVRAAVITTAAFNFVIRCRERALTGILQRAVIMMTFPPSSSLVIVNFSSLLLRDPFTGFVYDSAFRISPPHR
jgi:hypothetical protein